ncbi:MAG: DUF3365 domain-containing protein [Desulfobacteraceae bacterium]|uniref:histidine kinase n=1 Tax=Candidatus Desulfaltia bathyphila TaxID=2841697 RepID=A0A8J6N4C7_9BACT|nr:DUF3365 domain-containing protein [Candidatus Desulfaltia bathyphila]MBL7196327.1 DUF3365 domain-containing protein [Desulfobacterales bacterium]
MNRIRERFPEFQYIRAANNPRNHINQADDFELKMMQWFTDHHDNDQWSGIVNKNGQSFYARLKPIYAEKGCLYCHGKPEDAPQELKNIYGTSRGYGYAIGDIVAVESIYIPVDVTFLRIKQKIWWDFILGTSAFFILFGLMYLLFNNTVVSQIRGLLTVFRNIAGKDEHLAKDTEQESADEIDQLKKAFEDVASHLKQIHEELKASEKKYRSLFETSQDTIFICDMDTRIVDINEAGLKLFKFIDRIEALAVESFYQLFWDARDAAALFAAIQQKGFAREQEYDMVDRDAKRMHVMITANMRIDDNGMPCGFEGMLRDVTEKRRLARYLAQTEKMASIGQLAAGVAHETNNPLEVIRCYANLIQKELPPDSRASKDIEIIKKHTLQCKSVIEALLNFARASEPEMVKADINACIENILSVVERQANKDKITVRRKFSPDIPLITMDVQKMKQVIMNLIMNAEQSIEKNGVITVITKFQKKDRLVIINIEDTGCGIPEKDIDRIFDPFFTTKGAGKGTGLGLSVSYGIIEQHGVRIDVKSTQGKGSCFIIILPATDTENDKTINS